MKKLFAIIAATLVVCGLCVAPAYADIYNTSELKDLDHGVNAPYYPTDVTDIDIDEEAWLAGGESGSNTNREMPKPPDAPTIDFDIPDAPGDYEFHLYGPWLGEDDQPLPYDLEYTWDDGTGAYLAFAETEDEAVSMAEQYAKDNQSETKQFSEVESGYWPDEDIVIEEAWTETVHHDAETHTEVITEEVSEGWAKCDVDGQSSYDFTGDKLIIHDGQTGYWFWSAQPMDNWKEFAESTGINKANLVAYARSGYGIFNSKQTDETKRIIGGKTFTIEPGKISADGGISWTAWEHFKTIEVGTETVVDKEAWDETIEHPAVVLHQRAAGWANVTWETIEAPTPVPPSPVPPAPVDPDPEDPVIPDEPSVEPSDNPDDPILDPVVEPVVSDNGNQQLAEVTYLPKTGDHLGDLDSIIAITITVCLAAIFLALCRRFDNEE